MKDLTKKRTIIAAKTICKVAILSAIAFVLHLLRFPMPFMFPGFLDFQISDMPGVLAGFAMGPIAGSAVILVKTLLKFVVQGSSFGGIGELADVLIGCAFVVTASLIYKKIKNKKGALIGLIIGTAASCIVALILNRFALIPFMANAYGWQGIISSVSALFPAATEANFYNYYLPLTVLPFNLLRCAVSALIAFLIYKKLSSVLHW
ncbi:MAG: ECF transporter S component [Clostridia bacterium]